MAMRKAMMAKRLFDQASRWVSQNPNKTRRTMDKVQTTVNQKTGGKYSHHLGKASSAVTDYFDIAETAPGGKQAGPSESDTAGQSTEREPRAPTEAGGDAEPREPGEGTDNKAS